jgi:hypothetical protein
VIELNLSGALVSNTDTSSTTQVLTQIWQRVLQCSTVGLEDNFFDLGGNWALAIQLCEEIAEICGQQLPPVIIARLPTIASQRAFLARPNIGVLSTRYAESRREELDNLPCSWFG